MNQLKSYEKARKGSCRQIEGFNYFFNSCQFISEQKMNMIFFLFNSSINSYKPKKKGLQFHINKVLIFQVFITQYIQDHCRVEIDGKLHAKPRPLLWPTPKWRPFQLVINSGLQNTKKKRLENKGSWFMNFLTKDLFRSL